jgi:hypothetical protein
MEQSLKPVLNFYKKKLSELSEIRIRNGFNLGAPPDASGSLGINVVEEAVLVRVLGDERQVDGDRLTELFEEKKRNAWANPKVSGYSTYRRKKFVDFPTLLEAYKFLQSDKALKSRAFVGITDNVTGKFLFFDEGRKIDTWLQACVDGYTESLREAVDFMDNMHYEEPPASTLKIVSV